jgi:hypothetical protein
LGLAAMTRHYINLQPSEAVLVRAAAQIFAAYISSGQCTRDKEDEYLKKSLQLAIRLAKTTDDVVQADKET